MARDGREIVVGMAVSMALALTLGLSYGGSRLKPVDGYTLTATFNRVDGLSIGDDVRLSGMKVGSVERQDLDDRYRALVTLRIVADVKLPTDTAAAIHTDGLFGTKFVILDPGGEDALLDPGGAITFTQDAVLVDELLELIIAEGKARGAAKGAN